MAPLVNRGDYRAVLHRVHPDYCAAMVTPMDSDALTQMTSQQALAALRWQIELGADEVMLDTPINRYELEAKPPAAASAPAPDAPPPIPARPAAVDPVALARRAAGEASDLDGLRAAIAAFEGCELKEAARSCVFCDGAPAARVMLVGEAPGRDEDREGRPFVGAAGQLLDAMLGAAGFSRSASDPDGAVYITNVLPWRPPQNRAPTADEIALFLPFLERHIALANPDILVVMGNTPAQALLGRTGITRMRGTWTETQGRPCLPMLHPAYLLRQPMAKRDAWADMLALRSKLRGS